MTLPSLMHGVFVKAPGGPDMLEMREAPMPAPGPGQILIRVAAAGVNRPDILQRQGSYPAPKGAPEGLGLEAAGEVVRVGEDCRRYRPGDAVCALLSGGGYADYCVADEDCALPVPSGLNLVEAGSLPETVFTVAHNVFERGGLRAGETLLVHGGASGVGAMAIQMAKAEGARVVATAGSAGKCAFCLSLGADRAVNYHEEDFVEAVKAETEGRGADVILDMVGGDYLDRNLRAAAEDGRIVQIAFLRGSKATADFMRLMLKRLTLTGSTLRARPLAVKAAIARAAEARFWPRIASGAIRPVIDSRFPLAEAARAHERMESNRHMGKIMLIA